MQNSFNILRQYLSISFLAIAFLFWGCNRKPQSEHDHDESKEHASHDEKEKGEDPHGHGKEEGAGAAFAEGKGLKLTPETTKVLGLKTVEVTERSIEREVTTTAQIYRSAKELILSSSGFERSGYAYASAFLDPQEANSFNKGQAVEVKLEQSAERRFDAQIAKIDRAMESFSKQVEVILEIKDPSKELSQGTFVHATLSGASKKITVVPLSAILNTSTGIFVYVVNGDYLFRTPVEIGMQGDGFIEVKQGLYEGDVIVEEPVQKLWLIELRFTKGGGHSH